MKMPRRVRMLTSMSGAERNLVFGQELRVPEELSAAEAIRFASPEHAACEVIEWQELAPRPAPAETATIHPPENAAARTARPRGRTNR